MNKLKITIVLVTIAITSPVLANPVLNGVTAGNVSITQTPSTTQVQQSSQQAVIEWRSFNIGAQEHTHFQQPAGGIALNRIDPSQGISQIFGQLSATGKIILVNQAGIFFGPGARVDVSGIIATTSNISNANFLAGKYIFDQPSSFPGASIVNAGTIRAANHGLVALVGNNVDNRGLIQANMGNIVLASGNKFTLSFDNDQLINFSITEQASGIPANRAAVSNTGTLLANGGKILLTAQAARGVLDNAINMQGVAMARSVHQRGGEIILAGGNEGTVAVSAKLIASGKRSGQTGGKVHISGQNIVVNAPTKIDVRGDRGGGEILIGGNAHGAGPVPNASYTYIAPQTKLIADAITQGNGGNIIVWADNVTSVHGDISAKGGAESGNGGFVETSGHYLNVSGTQVNLTAPHGTTGTWLLDPENVTISNAADTNNAFFSGGNPNTYNPTQSNSNINVTTLAGNLGSANVNVTTGTTGTDAGDITVASPLTWSSSNTLTLNAANNIFINAGITATNGSLTLASPSTLSADISTGGTQNYNNTVTLANNVVLTGSQITMPDIIGAGFGLTINNSSDSVISGVFSGGFGTTLTKGGAGTLALSSVNTYQGTTTINAGTLRLDVVNALPFGRDVVLANTAGALLDLNNNSAVIGTLSGGGTTGGDISLGSGTLTVIQNSAQTYGGVISGSGGLRKEGNNTLALSGANVYTGTTYINTGTLRLDVAGNVLPSNSDVFLADNVGATLDLNNNDETIGNLSGGGPSGGNITLGSGTLTVMQTQTGGPTYQGVISGTGGLIKESSGLLVLSGVNTYTGTTTINAGTLGLGTTNAIADSSGVILANAAGAQLDTPLDNTINTLSGGGTTGGNIIMNGALTVVQNSPQTYGGVISGSGSFTKSGGSTLTLSGANTYSGTTTINAGTLQLGASNVIADNSDLRVLTGATFDLNIFNETVGSLIGSGSSGSTIDLGSATLTLTQTNATPQTFLGVIQGSGGLTKAGSGIGSSGILTLSAANTYTGDTNVNTGILVVGNASALGSTAGGTTVASGGRLSIISGVSVGAEPLTLNGGQLSIFNASGTASWGGNITLSSDSTLIGGSTSLASLVIPGSINGAAGLTLIGSGNVVLSGANTYGGSTTINGGTLRLNASNVIPDSSALTLANIASAVFDLNGFSDTIGTLSGGGAAGGNISLGSGTLTVSQGSDQTYAGVISGAGSLVKAGNNILTLSGVNTYGGSTTIDVGTLRLGASNVIPDSSTLTLANLGSAAFDLNGFSDAINSLSGGGGAGGNVLLGSGTLTVNQGNYAGVISGAGGLTKLSSNILTLSGANTYTGATTINDGTLNLDATGSLSDSTALTLANVANAIFSTIFHNETIGSLAGGGTTGGNVNLGATVLTAGGNNSSTTFDGLITSGSVASGLTKEGSGSLVLTGNNTFPGPITINGGTLELSGTNNATAANLNSGTLRLNANDLLPSTIDVTIANSVATLFDLNNNNQTVRNFFGGTSGGSVNLGSGTLTVNSNTALPYGGVISGTGGLTIGGLTALTGNNTYSGTTNITGTGTLTANADNAFSPFSAVVLANVGSALLNASTFNNTIASLSGGGTVQLFQLTVGDGNSTTFSGFLNGPSVLSNLTKKGSGTLTLDGNASNFFGTMTINEGTIQLGASNTLSTSAKVALADTAGATFDLNNNSKTISSLSGGGATGGNVNLGSGTLTVTQGSDQTYAGVIGGSGGLTIAGIGGILTLSGSNTYTGTTAINSGTLRLGASNVIPDSSALTLANLGSATFNLNGFSDAIGTLSGGGISGGNISLGSGTLTVNQGSAQTYAGVISGSGGLTKAGSSILTLSRPSTYTGTTFISDGTLRLGASNVLPNNSALSLANTAGAAFDMNGLIDTIGTLSGGGAAGGNILGVGTLTINQGSNQTYAGVISGTPGNLIKAGNSILGLTGTNTYGGSTTITAGILRLGAANVIPDSSALALSNTVGAAFDLNGFSETIGRLSGGGAAGGNISLGAGTLTVTQQGINQTFAGVISGAGSLVKAGNNTLTLSGVNTYGGSTTINAGTLTLGVVNALLNTNAVILNGGTFDLNNLSPTIGSLAGSSGTVSIGSGTLTLGNNNTSTTYSGVINGTTGGLTKIGTGNQTLGSDNSYTGVTDIQNGTLTLGSANAIPAASALSIASTGTLGLGGFNKTLGGLTGQGNINLGTATLTINNSASNTYDGILSGSGNLIKTGTGTLILTGANNYSGTTDITQGILSVTNNSGLGTSATVSNGATLNMSNTSLSNNVTLNGAGVGSNGALTSTGTATLNGNIGLGSDSTIGTSGNLTLNGLINGAANLNFIGSGTTTLSGAIGSITPLASLTSSSSGTTNIGNNISTSGNQAYNNPVNLIGATTLTGSTITLDTVNGAFGLTLNGNTVLNNTVNIGALTSNANTAINTNSITTAGSQIYNGPVSLSTNTALLGNGAIALMNGVAGGLNEDLSLMSNTGSEFVVKGTLASINDLTITGGTGMNTLTFQTNNPIQNFQQWSIPTANNGTITNISGVAGTISFNGIQNISGTFNNNPKVVNDKVSIPSSANATGTVIDPDPIIAVTIGGITMIFNGISQENFSGVDFGSIIASSAALNTDIANIVSVNTTDAGTGGTSVQDALITQRLQTSLAVTQDVDAMAQQEENKDIEYTSSRKIYPNCGRAS